MVNTRARIVHKQPAGINRNFPGGIELDERTIHGTRRWAFKVHTFTVITASMTRALKFVFRRLPFGRATKVGTPGENDEKTIGLAYYPNAIGHQEALIDS